MENSELNQIIPPEIKNDELFYHLNKIAKEADIKTILEIGSSSGEGSTLAFVTGILENQNQPNLYCLEVSKPRFFELQNRYAQYDFVKCYNISSVSLAEFPDESEISDFYKSNSTNLNLYPLEMVLGWLRQDIEYIKSYSIESEGIEKIKKENNIDNFDLVLIDGSEFTGLAELEEVYGAKYICLDDVNTFKNYQNRQRLSQDNSYTLIAQNLNLRNGYAIFKKTSSDRLITYKSIQPIVEAIEGFMVPGQEKYLFNKVKALPDRAVIVEIGSYKGRSTVAMAYACIGSNRKIYCIDTWDGNDSDFPDRKFFDIWQNNIEKNGLSPYVIPLQGYSHQVLSQWQELAGEQEIDFIFIDGSHQFLDVLKDFELSYNLIKEGGWIAFHDVVPTWPGSERVWHKIAKNRLINHEYSSTLACGQKQSVAIPSHINLNLPIHFFTIVLNGKPFIDYHIEVFRQLPYPWHWHIIEGVADLKHDTAWSLPNNAYISNEIHHQGRSKDGTSEYLDELVQLYPENVTVYRKPEGIFWDGKREMVNAPLVNNIRTECLLWQVDVDELWTAEQICIARQMFIENPTKTAAFYWCWYFVGEKLIISTRNCYAQNPDWEWLRTWRYQPGAFWARHEPPRLCQALPSGEWQDLAELNPFLHEETEKEGLIFQHFAYVTPEQLQFKEQYYGYQNAVSQWEELQKQTKLPILLREHFQWVFDDTMVDTIDSYRIVPIAQKEENTKIWRFLPPEKLSAKIDPVQKVSPKILIDGVFFQLHQTGIARVWKSLLAEWTDNGFAKYIIVLDRGGTAPKMSGVKYKWVPPYNYANIETDREMLQEICDEESADLFISTYYTTPITTPSVFMVYDMIPEVMGSDLREPVWQEKHHAINRASAYISISKNTANDLARFFPAISLDSIKVAYCGVSRKFYPALLEEINSFKIKYGMTKPYFLSVGGGTSHKNNMLFFKAFSQLCTKQGFEIVCTGTGFVLESQFRAYTEGVIVHLLQLSDEELRLAYAGAVALVYPSKYEGFGLPVLEAMSCGCPVITCANASIPEVAGTAALYVNDEDINGLTNALCEVQKNDIRNSLRTAGFAQAQNFSWSKMANTVAAILINTTLLHLKLREINLIVFPDWRQPEAELGLDLATVLKAIASHPDKNRLTLLIDISNIEQEDADLLLSSIVMNLLMEEDLDVTAEIEISLMGNLSKIQWEALMERLHARIILTHENQEAIAQVGADRISTYQLVDFSSNLFQTETEA